MTNKIEISRDQFGDIIHLFESMQSEIDSLISYAGGTGGYGGNDAAIEELRALLAAPVVERQEPVAWQWIEPGDEFNGYKPRERLTAFRPTNMQARSGMAPLYAAPPGPVSVVPFKMIDLPQSLKDHHAFNILQDKLAEVGVMVSP